MITEITDYNKVNAGPRVHARSRPLRPWIPTLLLCLFVAALRDCLPAWAWMWAMALALFAGAKVITISPLLASRSAAANSRPPVPTRVSRLRLVAYFLFWPGLDARAFCEKVFVPKPALREWILAVTKTLFGALLLWPGVRILGNAPPLAAAWTGMLGIVFLLHFGLFHLLSLLWRALGVNAQPIMLSPATATSLSRFWGGRWNAAFTVLMHEHIFKPLARGFGARRALLLVFLISGLLHELVISVPARGGYGLPTAYFAIQGLGLLFERSASARRIGLGAGWRGWCFLALVAGAPVPVLFHPIFIRNVILPMLHAIGAT